MRRTGSSGQVCAKRSASASCPGAVHAGDDPERSEFANGDHGSNSQGLLPQDLHDCFQYGPAAPSVIPQESLDEVKNALKDA